ncbi:DUF4062 domain-containing protein [Mesorhizobium sp. B2-3-11]|uniref:DUF4062 domain-containing protein n=1 Tax=Mesorhizobium sp. B2-3-11 TaxID=2589953 RepID=UPI00112B5F3E|nr:DUF4062 domain-containing protein [Mesorhizobium sp. B2-3-11]TPM02799.1 DUF4062 domain-containing protein [Mesorhizobium sp. B2-3-11]
MDRPTLFLSSTVYDFLDLRSALKDYLELRGCRVLASEFTDFTHPLDKHSYEACLAAIEQADLFVLFIGRRVGGWFDEPNQISITRAEYRHAYELAKAKKIRILCFVRSDVWDHRQSVRDLAKALRADPELSDQQRERLANHPSLVMENAKAVISFIEEVAKNNETAAATKGLGTAPIANWIWPFATFTQVRQAIDPLVLNGLAVRDAAARKALEEQLLAMLLGIVPRITDGPSNPINAALNVVKELGLNSSNFTGTLQVSEKTWNRLVVLVLFSMDAKVDPTPLQAHLSSGLLLEYDPAAGAYRQTSEFDLLVKVINQAKLLEGSGNADGTDLLKCGKSVDRNGSRMVPAVTLTACAHRLLRWVDLIQTGKALARSLAGKPVTKLVPIPPSPILDQVPQLEAEAVTPEQMRAFIND